jgi:hypothetical protein
LTASNPGQFYYNIFYVGTLGTSDSFTITLPYPFVTQGAMPVHVYSSLNTGSCGCLFPVNDITSQFTITINNGYPDAKDTTITVSSKGTYAGSFVYINVHMDYGLKKNIGDLNKNGNSDATSEDLSVIKIHNNNPYLFSVSGPGSFASTDTIYNVNVFKRDPGFGGLVLNANGDPVAGVKVQIYDSSNKLLATVYTDEDGFYMYNYKHTGKAATFTIKLPTYNLKQSVTVKANSFALANFQLS